MAEIKTKPTDVSVEGFLETVESPARRADARAVRALMERVSGEAPLMWGPSIVGFGRYRYRYASGQAGEMCRMGFSPRKTGLVLYVLTGAEGEAERLSRLGKHQTGKACLYVARLADVDLEALEEVVAGCWAWMNQRYPEARSS